MGASRHGQTWRRKGIYYNRLSNGDILLLLVYAKAKFDDIRPKVLLKIKEKYDV